MDQALAQRAASYGVQLSDAQLQQFEAYQSLLLDWSQRMNLVGDASTDVVRARHFVESIALGAALREREILRPDSAVLDVGAGAGFPGLVLKIVWPGIKLTLIEATSKKTAFLAAACDSVGFPDVHVLTGRAETLAHDPELRGRFDLVVARAVAPLPTLLEFTMPFARVGGRVVTPKGSRVQEEVASAATALGILGGKALTLPLRTPGPAQTLVIVIKRGETPDEYPRRPGIPAKAPL